MNSSKQKIYSVLVATLLLIGVLAPLVVLPIPVVQGARGGPKLAAVNCTLAAGISTCTDIKVAQYNVSIAPGALNVSRIDNVSVMGYFALVFTNGSESYVQFDGAVFDLYISKDGYSALDVEQDIKYAGPFRVSDLFTRGLTRYVFEVEGETVEFWIGTVTIGYHQYSLVIGPVSFVRGITPEYQYIKVYDGKASQVAVTGIIDILPSLRIRPSSGPGGAEVVIEGIALWPNVNVSLTYTNVVSTTTIGSNPLGEPIGWNITTSDGYFVYRFKIHDLGLDWIGNNTKVPYANITIGLVYASGSVRGRFVGSVTYTEYARAFVQLRSTYPDVAQAFYNLTWGAGNESLTVVARVGDTITLAGAWWNPTSPVTIRVGNVVTTATPNATGFFNVSFTVPPLPGGRNAVVVENAGVRFIFYIDVKPTLIITPTKGTVGTTVNVTVYGFPANSLVGIWWEVVCSKLGGVSKNIDGTTVTVINVVNGTTGPDGMFNVTVTFKVPLDTGGSHRVFACSPWDCTAPAVNASVTFVVEPAVVVQPQVFANDYSEVLIVGTGLKPGQTYYVLIDNQLSFINATCDVCGRLNITIIAAGFRPGFHVVALYEGPGIYNLSFRAPFTVLCEGDYECEILSSISSDMASVLGDLLVIKTDVGEVKATLAELEPVITEVSEGVATLVTKIGTIELDIAKIKQLVEDNNAKLVSISGDVATIATDVGVIKAKVEALEPVITEINDTVAIIRTKVGTLPADLAAIANMLANSNAMLTTISGDVATIATDVGEIKITIDALKDIEPKITSIDGKVAQLDTKIGSISTDIGTLETLVETLGSDVGEVKAAVDNVGNTVSNVKGTVDSISGKVNSIDAKVTDLEASVKSSVDALSGLSTAVWLAVIFSVIAAVAAIFGVITVMRKIAG